MSDSLPIKMLYRNHKGHVAWRNVIPYGVWWGTTEWHREPCWLLNAYDLDKSATRKFALKDALSILWDQEGEKSGPEVPEKDRVSLIDIQTHNEEVRKRRDEQRRLLVCTGVACPLCREELLWDMSSFRSNLVFTIPVISTGTARCAKCNIAVDLER